VGVADKDNDVGMMIERLETASDAILFLGSDGGVWWV
jgi:hypothetical protein